MTKLVATSMRITPDNHVYLTRLAAESGLSMTKITDALITECRARDFKVTRPSPAIVAER
jgi:hypothetical protein